MIIRARFRVISESISRRIGSRAPTRCQNKFSPYILPLQSLYRQRPYSTPTTNDSIPKTPLRPLPPTYFTKPKPKRSLRPYIYATIFLLLGVTAAQYVNLIVAPPPLPLPDSHEDKLMVEFLTQQAEEIPLVKSLMEDPNWAHHQAYGAVEEKVRAHRLTTGPLGGARGIGGFQRVFLNAATGEHIIVVWIGGALAGWPGVTHGGITATLVDEALGRCAIALLPGQTGVTANLELNYMKPLITNSFYVIRSMPQKEGSSEKKQWVSGRIETLDGKVCVEARALFVVPKKFLTKPIGKI